MRSAGNRADASHRITSHLGRSGRPLGSTGRSHHACCRRACMHGGGPAEVRRLLTGRPRPATYCTRMHSAVLVKRTVLWTHQTNTLVALPLHCTAAAWNCSAFIFTFFHHDHRPLRSTGRSSIKKLPVLTAAPPLLLRHHQKPLPIIDNRICH